MEAKPHIESDLKTKKMMQEQCKALRKITIPKGSAWIIFFL